MRKTFLASTSAIILIAGTSLAIAQGSGREAPSPAPGAQQSAPAEKMSPGSGAQQQPQKAPDAGTTGQGSPQRMEQDRPAGAQAPSGARESQDRVKSGDPKASEPKASGTKAGDKPSSTTQAPGSQQNTTGQGAAGASGAVNMTTEQRTKISTTIKQTNVRPVTNVNFNISVGATVPRTVELHPLPAAIIEIYPQWRGYRFVLVRDEIIIIEPDTYRIVAVIEV